MVDESINNPHDPMEERFAQLKSQVANINHNMSLLMVALNNKLWIFNVYGCSNIEVRSKRRSGDREQLLKDPKKEPKKEQPSLSVVNHS